MRSARNASTDSVSVKDRLLDGLNDSDGDDVGVSDEERELEPDDELVADAEGSLVAVSSETERDGEVVTEDVLSSVCDLVSEAVAEDDADTDAKVDVRSAESDDVLDREAVADS